ncbi:ExbD/TolR family protein [Sphingomonas sp. PR090111-T3T-6A]|uniref:ExbD/TolR family protein n=1 Tax=Sphingomonas sp. PR090111-T3T-6A TaxID=685778 RepID=UPI00039A5CF4|nr:biopolymer transporter ExbD [Sphingomonas sp. PR090111-T3T-6A]
MAMAAGTAEGEPMMDINTTPLIDVMLVLLIMFIITIPIQTHAVKLDLPVNTNSNPPPINPTKNTISTDAAGAMFWNGQPVPDLVTLRQYIDLTKNLPDEPELHLLPDPNTRYDTIDNILAVVKKSQVGKFGFEGNERYADAF